MVATVMMDTTTSSSTSMSNNDDDTILLDHAAPMTMTVTRQGVWGPSPLTTTPSPSEHNLSQQHDVPERSPSSSTTAAAPEHVHPHAHGMFHALKQWLAFAQPGGPHVFFEDVVVDDAEHTIVFMVSPNKEERHRRVAVRFGDKQFMWWLSTPVGKIDTTTTTSDTMHRVVGSLMAAQVNDALNRFALDTDSGLLWASEQGVVLKEPGSMGTTPCTPRPSCTIPRRHLPSTWWSGGCASCWAQSRTSLHGSTGRTLWGCGGNTHGRQTWCDDHHQLFF